ncbi:MAG: hypothetical protein EOM22_02185 [Gammaproteobacteria bacterium]|nr:hypothetical protein [Gammaproteobacteria bacterium]
MSRIQDIGQGIGKDGVALLVFASRGLRFAAETRRIHGIADIDPGRDARVPALADLLGLTYAPGMIRTSEPRERLLRFRRSAQARSTTGNVRIEEPIALCRRPCGALYPLPALVATLSTLPCVRGLVRLSAADADGFGLLLDLRRLPEDDRIATRTQSVAARAST